MADTPVERRCYDATTESAGDPFANAANVEKAYVIYHAYPWTVDSGTSPASNWIEQLRQIPEGSLVCIDYEPRTNPDWGPLDPRTSPLEEVQETHAIFAEALLKILPVAKKRSLRVGVYSWVDLFPNNDTLIIRDPDSYSEWQGNVKRVADLAAIRVGGYRLSVMDLIRDMDGHNWVPFYWQTDWGKDQPDVYPWRAQNATQCIERVAAELDSLNVPTMPLLMAGPIADPYSVNFNRIQLRAIKSRFGREFAVWGSDNFPIPQTFVTEAIK